ncbi:MAG: ribulose-phosphate 3-epimerase [Sphaerochaetaceae bacterium]|nr:ribulose-phosphate 3-epimerase [Sphaerochaetaceae bacterium]
MHESWNDRCIITPSLITLDLCNLEQQVHILKDAGMTHLHVDILDGYFSPSFPLGLEAVKQLRDRIDLEFDVHLMVKEQQYFVDELISIGVQQILFHVEEESHVDNMLNYIRGKGVRAGLALKPATSLTSLDYVLDKCDAVLLMLINPGYAGSRSESKVPYAHKKIMDLRSLIDQRQTSTLISIDGRISLDDIQTYTPQFVDMFVTGSTCLNRNDLAQSAVSLMKFREDLLHTI